MIAAILAYLGPGGALTAIGSAVALLAAVAFAFLGMIWYPIRRLLRWRRRSHTADERPPS